MQSPPLPPMFARLSQRSGKPLRKLNLAQPSLILVVGGEKTVSTRAGTIIAGPGDVAVLPGGITADVINTPDTGGLYSAEVVAFDPGTVERVASRSAGEPAARVYRPTNGFRDCWKGLSALFAAPEPVPASVLAHRAGELLLWLTTAGISLVTVADQGFGARARMLIEQDVGKDWQAPDIARRLAVGDATLRRHLASEGTSLTDILIDARMSRALALLQMTDQPVTTIALEVGYASPSRFAARFRARFGFPPSEIRGHSR